MAFLKNMGLFKRDVGGYAYSQPRQRGRQQRCLHRVVCQQWQRLCQRVGWGASKMAAVPQLTKSAQLIVQLAEPTVAFYLEPTEQKMVARSTEGRDRNVTKHRELMSPGGIFIGRRPQAQLLPRALLNA